MNFLSVSGISKQTQRATALKDIHFTQQRLENVAIAGNTGSGKTTLLKVIAGLAQPDAGEVWFEGQRVIGPEDKLMPGHKGIAYLSQQFELPPYYTVENILHYENRLSEEEAAQLYDLCRIRDLLTRRTDELSGGEKQRIALARTLIASPRLLLLDEPFSNADMHHKNRIKSVLQDIGEQLQVSFMLVSHEPLDILPWADTILIMKDGRIWQQGTPLELYHRPVDEYAAGLLGAYNCLQAEAAKPFASGSGTPVDGRRLLIRPEHVLLTNDAEGSVRGEITRITFHGSFYELAVRLPAGMLTVRTGDIAAIESSEVYLKIDPQYAWFI